MTDVQHVDIDDDAPMTGRPVRLVPTPPGFWMTILGTCLAAISPLFGFLIGTMMAQPEQKNVQTPIFIGLFIGVVIGAIGVLFAIIGGMRLWRQRTRESVVHEDAEELREAEDVA